MTFNNLKEELNSLNLKEKMPVFLGFEESHEFVNFNLFFALLNKPKYTIMQMKDSDEFQTSSKNWILCFEENEQLVVMDMADEETICDEFLELIIFWSKGFLAQRNNI